MSGCNGLTDGVCQACKSCGLGETVLRACDGTSNTMCRVTGGFNESCLDAREVPSYAWVGAAEVKCVPGSYLSQFDAQTQAKQCVACPPGWAGPSGVFCKRCGELEEPFFLDRSSCVCKGGVAVMNASGACVCPDGTRQSGGECVPCGANTRGVGGGCVACEAGKFALAGATACQACQYGQYRVEGQAGLCASCLAGWFAPDASKSVCVQCNQTCTDKPGMYDAGACPGGGGRVCASCPGGLPGNASWATWGNTTQCAYACRAGFYRVEMGCRSCTANRECEAGWVLTPCSEIQDSHCDVPCENATKPSLYSHWEKGNGCAWACDDGYEYRAWNYVLFELVECVLKSA